jgi:hypothetical protein
MINKIKNLRLSDHDLEAIERLFRKHFLSGDRLWIFGSRTDLNRKGGDIDLYVETDAISAAAAIEMKIDFLWELEKIIGEQKIDVVLNMLKLPYPLPIHDIAKTQGIRIV